MQKINSTVIEEAVYNLCVTANTKYSAELYDNLYCLYSSQTDSAEKLKLKNILENIKEAQETNRPLCQDTGQVIVFAEIGKDIHIENKLINEAINHAVECAYKENYFRLSTVRNALFDRNNAQTNTPAIIYTEITNSDEIKLKLLVKGAGSENYSTIKMFKPSSEKEEIFDFIKESIITAGEKSCPPLVLGIGAGGTMDKAAVLSKQAFFNENPSIDENAFVKELREHLGELNSKILDIKIKTDATHIACLPIALTINCHSTRHGQCIIRNNGIEYLEKEAVIRELPSEKKNLKELNTSRIEELYLLKQGEDFLLSGEIYTARDAAHEKIQQYYEENGCLPFELKDKIIFYAGPCPNNPDEVIGPIGPTTSARMDKFCEFMYSKGLLASIGKGERSFEAKNTIKEHNGRYFIAQGGIACLLAKCVKGCKIVAFEELGTEAVRLLKVEKLPLKAEI